MLERNLVNLLPWQCFVILISFKMAAFFIDFEAVTSSISKSFNQKSCRFLLATHCIPLVIITIMIVLVKILTLFYFKAIISSLLTLNEIMIALIAKGTQAPFQLSSLVLKFFKISLACFI